MGGPLPDSRDELITELRRQVEVLTGTITQLRAENQQLREQLEQAQREAARQAAPFRRREEKKVPKEQHKRAGRSDGHAGVNRPIPSHIDEEIDVPLEACPHCGGVVADCHPRVQYIEEIPPVQVHVIRLTTHRGRCVKCGSVSSTHPLQTGAGFAASQVHLGPRALALAATLSKHHGLTMRKTCRVLEAVCGLKLSAGGLSQALDRIADRVEADYQQLFVDARAGPATYVDETSWWVGGPGWWLWVFTNPQTTLYQVRDSRAAAVVTDALTANYRGVLVSDCLGIYDTVPFAAKHKCIAHHQKVIGEQLDSPGLRDRTYLEEWKSYFTQVSGVWKIWEFLPVEHQVHARKNYAAKRDELLSRELTQEQDIRIRNRLEKRKEHLLTCLNYPGVVEPTNNRAERALRPAVIARKVSCGNKTDRGRRSWQILMSLLTTWSQRGIDILATLANKCSLAYKG
jgi:hypothetical protein